MRRGLFLEARKEFRRRLAPAGLVETPFLLTCWRCHKGISSDLKWTCGACGFHNRRTQLYSFLNKCQKCEREPDGVLCCHCGGAVISDARPAKLVATATRETPDKPDAQAQRKEAHEREKERLGRQIEIAELKAKLAKAEKQGTPEKSEDDKKDEEVSTYVRRIMGYHKAIAKAKRQAAEDYKDDPDGLEKVNMALDDWRDTHAHP